MKIIRVFPRKTSLTPDDPMAFVGDPPLGLWRPEADEVHVSVTFTWDIPEAKRLRDAWAQYYDVVRIGGPAMGDCPNGFIPGMYIKSGVTFTTIGCNNNCSWCLVHKREGALVELDHFAPGHIIQDNNLLQATWGHLYRVRNMLNTQRRYAVFSGGIQSSLVNHSTVEWFKSLKGIKSIFLAADTPSAVPALRRAVEWLDFLLPPKDSMNPDQDRHTDKLRCYTMIGYNGETIKQATKRLETVWEIGCMPFAQLYQPDDHYIQYSPEWKTLARNWSRPAIMKKRMHVLGGGNVERS